MENLLAFTLSSLVSRGLVFLITPIMARLYSSEVFADYSLFISIVAMFTVALQFGHNLELTRSFFYDKENYPSKFKLGIYFVLLNAVVMLLCYLLSYFLFESEVVSYFGEINFFLITLLSSILSSLLIFYQLDYRSSKRVLAFSISEIARPLFFVVLICILPYFINSQTFHVCVAWVLATLISLLICLFMGASFKGFKSQISGSQLRQAYTLGTKTGFHYLSGYILPFLDKFLIKAMYTTKSLAIYSAGFTMGQLSILIVDLLAKVYTPSILERMKADESYYQWYLKKSPIYALLMMLALSPIVLVIIYLAAKYMLPSTYQNSIKVGSVAGIAFLFQIFYQSQFLLLYHEDKTSYLGKISFFSTAVSVALLFISVKYFYSYVPFIYGIHYFLQSIMIRYIVKKVV